MSHFDIPAGFSSRRDGRGGSIVTRNMWTLKVQCSRCKQFKESPKDFPIGGGIQTQCSSCIIAEQPQQLPPESDKEKGEKSSIE